MDVLINYMEKMTIYLSSLTIEYYVLKKNGYNHNFFQGKSKKSSLLEVEKMYFNSRCQLPWSAILEISTILKKNIFDHKVSPY